MPFPVSVQTVTLTLGPLYNAKGDPVQGAILSATLPDVVRILEDGAVLPSTVTARTGADGVASLTVVATDSTGLDRAGFTYRVKAHGLTTGIDVAMPAAAPAVDVEDLVPVEASSGTVWVPPGAFVPAPQTAGATGDSLTLAADGSTEWVAVSGGSGGPHAATHAEGGSDPVTITTAQVSGLGSAATTAATDYATAAQGATADSAVQPADLATVATTGAYTDLTGRPSLAAVATTGAYADLSGQPSIPDSPDDIGAAAAAHQHPASDITTGTLATARLGTGTADAGTFLRGDSTWAVPAGGGGGLPIGTLTPAGQFTRGFPFGYNTVQSESIAADLLHAYQIYLPVPHEFDEMGLQILSANAGATLRLAVYTDAGGKPGDLIVAHATALDCSTTGDKSQAVAATVIPAGTHWGVYQTGGAACASRTISPEYVPDISRTAFSSSQSNKRLSASRAAAALPSSLLAQAWTPQGGVSHSIMLRRAA